MKRKRKRLIVLRDESIEKIKRFGRIGVGEIDIYERVTEIRLGMRERENRSVSIYRKWEEWKRR